MDRTSLPKIETLAGTDSILHDAILKTVTYSDLFDYPLTPHQLHRYLEAERTTLPQIMVALRHPSLTQAVHFTQGLITLNGRDTIRDIRRKRRTRAAKLWEFAMIYGGIIARLPFVRMVAVTGSLSMSNPKPDADIDFFIVTEPGRLWVTRGLAIGVVHLAARFGIQICPNYLISEDSLEIEEKTLYTARELTQMIPLSGLDVYYKLRHANRWTDHWLPNAAGLPEKLPQVAPGIGQRLLELPFQFQIGDRLEAWEMKRKIARLSQQQTDASETRFTAEVCKGHFNAYHRPTLTRYSEQIATTPQLKLESSAEPSAPKILFGQSYFLRFDPKLYAAMQPYPPLGSMIAAGWMRSRGYDVALFDAMLADSESEWETVIRREQPDIAVLYEDNFNYLSKMCLLNMRHAAYAMIEMAKESGAAVIVAGSDPTDHAESYLHAGADFVIRGEGEETLAELVDQLTGKSDRGLEKILGVSRLSNGKVIAQPARPPMRSVEHLPFPAWDLIDVDRYRAIWLDKHGYFSMNVVTTRGCPYHCNWCAKPIWGQRYTSRDPVHVAEEVIWLHESYAPDHIWFADDIMGLKPGWWRRFADRLAESNVRIPFKCLSRADLLVRHNADIDGLASAGCDIVWIGAESGSQKVLDAMEKGTTVEQIYAATERLHAAGVKIAFFLQFGYPGEEWEEIQQTLQMIRDCQPDDIGISVSYPLPGTRFHESVKQQLGHKRNWTDSADLDMLYQGRFSTEFYRQLHTVIHLEFRSAKGIRTLSRVMSRPWRWRATHVREAAAILYRLVRLPFARRTLQQYRFAPTRDAIQPLNHMSLEEAAIPSPQDR